MNTQAENETFQYMTKLDGDDNEGYNLQILRKQDDSLIDISTLCGDIEHKTSLEDSPGQLTFFIQKDPNGILNTVQNGDGIFFKFRRKDTCVGIFMGYVFNIGTDATNVFRITAYDQTRYLKNEDNMLIRNMTVSQIFEKICKENQLKYRVVTPIDFIPSPKIYTGKTYYSILKDCIRQAEVDAWQNKNVAVKYFIRDNYGTLELVSAENLLTNIVIGYQSCLSSYQFETSIDKGTYNSIKLSKKVNVEGKKKKGEKKDKNIVTYQQIDTPAINKWGLLQKVVEADENINEAQAKEMAGNYLRAYCRETKTLTLSALGILGLNAGVGFKVVIPDLNTNLNMYALEATHRYSQDLHTMDLAVNANDLEVYFK